MCVQQPFPYEILEVGNQAYTPVEECLALRSRQWLRIVSRLWPLQSRFVRKEERQIPRYLDEADRFNGNRNRVSDASYATNGGRENKVAEATQTEVRKEENE